MRVERVKVVTDRKRHDGTIGLRHLGDADVMAGQLGHLLEVMALPSVSLGVIPFTAPRDMWPIEHCP
jgi:Domain of unknown function (DUF5753)